jgi:hypothetical protein
MDQQRQLDQQLRQVSNTYGERKKVFKEEYSKKNMSKFV